MRLLLLLSICSLALVALSCGGSSSSAPEPRYVSFNGEGSILTRVMDTAKPLLEQRGYAISQMLSTGGDIVVDKQRPKDEDAVAVPVDYWVAAVQLPSPVHDITMQELADAVAGKSDRWRRIILPEAGGPPWEEWWPGLTGRPEGLPPKAIPAALAADPSALAFMRLADVDAQVRSLTVDDVNIVFDTGDLKSYGLTQHAWITKHHDHSDRFNDAIDAAVNEIADKLTPLPDPIIIRATGDIIPSRCAYAKQLEYGDFRHAFLPLGPWLSQADITTGSLDASISDVSPPIGCEETFNLAAPGASVEGLAYAGFDLIANAANHTMDCGQVGACGPDAMFATKSILGARGIQVAGTGTDLADARKPVIIESHGVRFAFLGYDDIQVLYHAGVDVPGTAPLDETYVREDVAAAKAQADVVIVMPHWGIEYTSVPTERQQTIAAAAFEAGATMVIGNHPHWVQAVQATPGRFITYALGNFVFDQDWSLETQQGAVLQAAFHGDKLKGIDILPVHIYDQHQPAFAEGDEAQQILGRIWDASAQLP